MIQNTNSLKTLPHTFHLRLRKRTLIKKNNALKEVFMPALSSTMTEGKIVSWLKGEGDKITKGESLVVIESDKADMDVDSFDDGILAAVMIQEGESASVGTPIAFIAESEAEVAEAKMKAAGTDATSTHSTTPIKHG
jgi:pyruvate dehydrogenase E2 component (dihydrolipoamide acetyltransferase)